MKNRLLWVVHTLCALVPDALAAGGAVLISAGCWQIFAPLGMIVAGALCVAAAVIVSKGSGAN